MYAPSNRDMPDLVNFLTPFYISNAYNFIST